MSGGSFNYAYSRVAEFSEELDDRINNASKENAWGEQPHLFEPATLEKLREIQMKAAQLSQLMRAVEYLYSGDMGEERFLACVADLQKPPASGKVGEENLDR